MNHAEKFNVYNPHLTHKVRTMNSSNTIQSAAVTGALGNLGWKLLCHLAQSGRFTRLVGLDIVAAGQEKRDQLVALSPNGSIDVEFVECDLTDWHDQRWQNALNTVESVVHFAALNPYPDATWLEAAISYDMTLHIVNAACDSPTVERVIFATSNHVMGRYKDLPLAETVAAGALTEELPPGVGTVSFVGDEVVDSTAYATSKLMGERLCRASGARTNGATTFVGIRIGWCQPGENRPETLSASGTPGEEPVELPDGSEKDEVERADRWFRGMWLSNRDFVQVFEKAIVADGSKWEDGFALVNGMSNNNGMKWSLEKTLNLLGYEPEDDVFAD